MAVETILSRQGRMDIILSCPMGRFLGGGSLTHSLCFLSLTQSLCDSSSSESLAMAVETILFRQGRMEIILSCPTGEFKLHYHTHIQVQVLTTPSNP